MSEDSWISTKNALPIVVGVNTTWLAVLTWWATSRMNELSCKITKLEDENKKLNKELLSDQKNQKKQNSLIKKISADLKRHEAAITELQDLESAKFNDDKPKNKGGKKTKISSETESESEESSESVSDSSSLDIDDMYKTLSNPKKKKKRRT